MAKMTPEMRPPDVTTERSKFDPSIGKVIFYPGSAVRSRHGTYRLCRLPALRNVRGAQVCRLQARPPLDHGPVPPPLTLLWVSDILDQIGNIIIVGMPWNYDKLYDEQIILAAA